MNSSLLEKDKIKTTLVDQPQSFGYEDTVLYVEQSLNLTGTAHLYGAKNAVLVIMASLLLTDGQSILNNVPASDDVLHMIALLQSLGARINFDRINHQLMVDTSRLSSFQVCASIMKRMRASVLVMGPLLARFKQADIASPGGCVIGLRPIDLHINNFAKMGVEVVHDNEYLKCTTIELQAKTIVLEYPSVGTTENIMMAAVLTKGTTTIINAALEPEVLDLIDVLKKMGAYISIKAPATIEICGVKELKPIEHEIVADRLEAGALLISAAITGGSVMVDNARADHLDVVLLKLDEMGHDITTQHGKPGIHLTANKYPKAVSFKTGPYPSFPTDLQAPMMALQTVAEGTSEIHETVFENRLVHVRELQKMGAQIEKSGDKVIVKGIDKLYGTQVIATDIRASAALVLAGLVAEGSTIVTGLHHWRRGYDALEKKLVALGAHVTVRNG